MAYGGEVSRQPIGHPWLLSLAGAVVAALLATFVLPWEAEDFATSFGYNTGSLLLPFAAAGVLLRGRAWPQWAALAGVVAVFLVVLFLVSAVRGASDDVRRRAAGDLEATPEPTAEASSGAGVPVHAPRSIGEWRKQTDRESRRIVAQTRDRLTAAPERSVAGVPALGIYGSERGVVFLVAYEPGPDLRTELEADPEQGAVNFLAGSTRVDAPEPVDAGPLGGGVACTDEADVPGGGLVCAWAASDVSGQLTLQVPGLTVDDAAPLVQQFREAVLRERA